MQNKYSIRCVFLSTLKKHAGIALLTLGTIIGSAVCALIAPMILGDAVDRLSEGMAVTFQMVFLYFLFTSLNGLLSALKEAFISVFGQKMTHGLRTAMSAKLYHLPASYFVNHDAGSVSSRFVNDVDTVEELFSSGIISMFSDLVSVVSIMAVIFTKSIGLGLLLLIVLPLIFLLTRAFQKKMKKAQLESRRAVSRSNGFIPDTLHNIRTVHVFHAEGFLAAKYQSSIEDNYKAMEKSNFYDAVYSPIVVTAGSIVIAIMMCLAARGGKYISLFGMSVGTAVTVISYVGKVFDPIQSIGMEIQNIQSAAAGMVRIREFMTEEERDLPVKTDSFNNRDAAVEIKNISFGYDPQKPVLQNFSLRLDKGEQVTLAGRTGCGKSTLLRLILGLYIPQHGRIEIFGRSINSIEDDERRKLFGYVEQTFAAIPGTIRDQLKMGDERVDDEKIYAALRIAGIEEEVKSLPHGLDTEYNPSLFSQGQQQLLSTARAVVLNPPILLLDEINANLDADTETQLHAALQKAAAGRTVITISHRMNDLMPGRIIHLDESYVS